MRAAELVRLQKQQRTHPEREPSCPRGPASHLQPAAPQVGARAAGRAVPTEHAAPALLTEARESALPRRAPPPASMGPLLARSALWGGGGQAGREARARQENHVQLGRQWLQALDAEGVQHTKDLTVHTRVSGQLGGRGLTQQTWV